MFRTSYEAGRVELFNMDPDPRQRHTVRLPCHHVMSCLMSCNMPGVGAAGGHHRSLGLSVRHQPGTGPAVLYCQVRSDGVNCPLSE